MLAGGTGSIRWLVRHWRGAVLGRERTGWRDAPCVVVAVNGHLGHEAIAVAPPGLDDPLCLSPIAERAPDVAQATLQRGITDGDPLPHVLAELVLGHDALVMLEQVEKQG